MTTSSQVSLSPASLKLLKKYGGEEAQTWQHGSWTDTIYDSFVLLCISRDTKFPFSSSSSLSRTEIQCSHNVVLHFEWRGRFFSSELLICKHEYSLPAFFPDWLTLLIWPLVGMSCHIWTDTLWLVVWLLGEGAAKQSRLTLGNFPFIPKDTAETPPSWRWWLTLFRSWKRPIPA